MVAAVPWNAALGFAVTDVAEGVAFVNLPFKPELVGDAQTGALHGGVITSLLDGSSGLAVFLKLQRMARFATLDLRIDYLRPAIAPHDVIARAECYKVTREIAFTRALAYGDDPANPIAAAAATFVILEDPRTPFARALP